MRALFLCILVVVSVPCLADENNRQATNVLRTDTNGPTRVWLITTFSNGLTVIPSVSTDGIAELDLGWSVEHGSWNILPAVGVDWRVQEQGVQFSTLIPYILALHYGQIHTETWVESFLPLGSGQGTLFHMRQLGSRALWNMPLWLGAQLDSYGGNGTLPDHFVGPLIEYEPWKDGLVSLTVQWSMDDHSVPSQYLLTVQTPF